MAVNDKFIHNGGISFCVRGTLTDLPDEIPFQEKILRELPPTFPEILEYLRIDVYDLSVQEMADRMGITIKTLERLRNKKRKTFAIDYIILLAVGLRLPPWLSLPILEKAGIRLQCTATDIAYGNILWKGYEKSLEEVQKYLKTAGVPKLKTTF